MRVFGYRAFFTALDADSQDPTLRPANRGSQEAVGQCHIEAHYAGRMAYRLYGMSALDESVLDTRCQFGFYHGIIEMSLGEAGDDIMARGFAKRCERYADDPLRRAFCTHALGHGLMVHYSFDLPTAAAKCTELVPSLAGKRMCYHGVFMENAFAKWGVGVSGHVSPWVDDARPDFPCDSKLIPQEAYIIEMCYADQSLIWGRKRGGFDVRGAVDGCLRAPASARAMCFTGLGFNMAFAMGNKTLTDAELVRSCSESPRPEDRINCLLGAIFMRSTHWWTFDGFKNPALCAALGTDDLDACDAYVWKQFSWLEAD